MNKYNKYMLIYKNSLAVLDSSLYVYAYITREKTTFMMKDYKEESTNLIKYANKLCIFQPAQ